MSTATKVQVGVKGQIKKAYYILTGEEGHVVLPVAVGIQQHFISATPHDQNRDFHSNFGL